MERSDVVMPAGVQKLACDCVADNPGLTRLHCHRQPQMDFGFKALCKYG